jgi:DNA-binding CsgD family transcriptional regulator
MHRDIETALLNAWNRVRPLLQRDPRELAARLARRRLPTLNRHPRASCICIRASDTRLEPHTVDLHHAPEKLSAQDVFIDTTLLRRLARPIEIPSPGLPAYELAPLLGVTLHALNTARRRGILRAHYVQNLDHRPGRPQPILYTDRVLDPTSPRMLFLPPDQIWDESWRFLVSQLPDDFQHILQRHPVYGPRASLPGQGANPSPSRRLPPAPPDPVWYKWAFKSQIYLGDDPRWWRKSPSDPGIPPGDPRRAAADAEFNAERERIRNRRRKYAANRKKSSSGSLVFRGWRWKCPGCGKFVNNLFYPVPVEIPQPLREFATNLRRRHNLTSEIDDVPTPPPLFACVDCIGVVHFSRVSSFCWNHLIAHFSSWLLYGHEVEKPAWLTPDRKVPFRPHLFPPSQLRADVKDRMSRGWTVKHIARDLGLTIGAVRCHLGDLYREYRVHNRAQLHAALKLPPPPKMTIPRPAKKREAVLARLRQNQSLPDIAKALNLTLEQTHGHAKALYKLHNVKNRVEFNLLLNLPLPTNPKGRLARALKQHHQSVAASATITDDAPKPPSVKTPPSRYIHAHL